MPAVPNLPGVPPLSSYSQNNVELLVADSLIAIGQIASLFAPQWGIYCNGQAVITPATILSSAVGANVIGGLAAIAALIGFPNIVPTIASTIEFDYSADSPISNYPQEQGAFQSYDKVQLPAEIGLTLACGGLASQRGAFLQVLEALRTSVALLDILTPEQTYNNYNLIHYDLRRTSDSGVTLIQANCKFQFVPVTASATPGSVSPATASISSPQSPSDASPQALGIVQPQPVFSQYPNSFSLTAGGLF